MVLTAHLPHLDDRVWIAARRAPWRVRPEVPRDSLKFASNRRSEAPSDRRSGPRPRPGEPTPRPHPPRAGRSGSAAALVATGALHDDAPPPRGRPGSAHREPPPRFACKNGLPIERVDRPEARRNEVRRPPGRSPQAVARMLQRTRPKQITTTSTLPTTNLDI